MTNFVSASAPGKLLLVGEYAVLEGGPALATAVSVRATAQLNPLAGKLHELYFAHSMKTVRFQCNANGNIEWQTPPGDDGLIVEAVIASLHELGLWKAPAESLRIQLDSRDFFIAGESGNSNKLGLGSSAAVCVALAAALLQYMGVAAEYSSILAAHRSFQQGRGSGVDVACSFTGGVIEFFRSVSGDANLRSLSWPRGLHALPVWSGAAASTSMLLSRLADYQQRAGTEYDRLMSDLGSSASYAITQWEAGQPDVILAALQDFSERLQSLDAGAKIGIWSDAHKRLGRIAAEAGAVYKPSGAGGGDFGIAFSGDEAQIKRLTTAYREEGFLVPDLEFSARGLEITEN